MGGGFYRVFLIIIVAFILFFGFAFVFGQLL